MVNSVNSFSAIKTMSIIKNDTLKNHLIIYCKFIILNIGDETNKMNVNHSYWSVSFH